jgi:hypothetical protein
MNKTRTVEPAWRATDQVTFSSITIVRCLKPTHSNPPIITDWEWINMNHIESMNRISKIVTGHAHNCTAVHLSSGREIHVLDSPESLWMRLSNAPRTPVRRTEEDETGE